MSLLVLLILLPSIVFSNEKLIVVTDHWPPFRVFNNNAKPAGIDIDLLKYLEKKLKVRVEVQQAPWVRALEMMRTGKADIMVGLAKTEDREVYIAYIEPSYYSVSPAFFYLKSRNLEIRKYDDLKKYLVGMTRASAYFEPFDSDDNINKYDVAQESQLLDLLLRKRIDIVIGTTPQVDYEIQHNKLGKLIGKTRYQPKKTTKIYVGISKRSSFLSRQSDIEHALNSFIKDGTLRLVTRQYLPVNE